MLYRKFKHPMISNANGLKPMELYSPRVKTTIMILLRIKCMLFKTALLWRGQYDLYHGKASKGGLSCSHGVKFIIQGLANYYRRVLPALFRRFHIPYNYREFLQ